MFVRSEIFSEVQKGVARLSWLVWTQCSTQYSSATARERDGRVDSVGISRFVMICDFCLILILVFAITFLVLLF